MNSKEQSVKKMTLILVGDSNIGKSTLIQKFIDKPHYESKSTIGLDLFYKTVKIDKQIVLAQIVDTSGQERFRSMTQSYFRDADGILLVFDISNKKSFDGIDEIWLQEVQNKSKKDIQLVLIGNKNDLETQREVEFSQAKLAAEKWGMTYIETSATKNQNVQEAFEALIKSIYITSEIKDFKQNVSLTVKKKRNQFTCC